MIKKYLRPLLITFGSMLALYGIVWACAGGWGSEYGSSGFTPEAFVDSTYAPFFYSEEAYYGIQFDTKHNTRFSQSNAARWRDYLGNTASETEIQYLLDSASQGTIDSAAAYTTGKLKKLPPPIAAYKLFSQKDAGSFLAYLSLAQQCELFAVADTEDWGEPKSKTTGLKGIDIVMAKLNVAFDKQQNSFIKQRLWFQLVRAKYFRTTWKDCIAFFDKHKTAFPQNEMYYRALSYAAGAYYKQGAYAQANYYYSLVFQGSDALKVVAHWSFHPQEEKDWNATLAMCKNNEERITLWQMLGLFYQDEMRSIKEIYKLDPKSDKLNLLLVRVVNKAEQNFDFHNGEYYGNEELQPAKDSALRTNIKEIEIIVDAGKTDKPYLWQVAYSYLNFLSNKLDVADKYLAKAEKNLPKQPLAEAQLRLLKLAVKVGRAKTINNSFEKNVLNDFVWLNTFKNTAGERFRHWDVWMWIRNNMSKKYLAQKEWVKAECFVHSSDFFADNNKVEAFKTFKSKSNLSPYEQLCNSLSEFSMSDLMELQAVQAAYNNKLDEAIVKMKQVTPASLKELAGNPFNGFIKDCHDCDHEARQKVKYNKLTFLQKIKEMEDKITAGDDVYGNAWLVGNAFYNMSHYGNARYFYEGKIMGESHYSPFTIDAVFRSSLIDMKWAKYYYSLALNSAQTNEQKAQCQYLLAKCERNDWFTKNVYGNKDKEWESNELPDFNNFSNYKILKAQYSNTAYYKEIIKECGWFQRYAKGK